MHIDGLHLALLGFLFTILGGVVVFYLTKSMFVRCSACHERHEVLSRRLQDGEQKFSRLEDQVRALVIYNERIPDEEKVSLVQGDRK